MAPPQYRIERRGTPKLHLEYGKHGNQVLATNGYFYIGDSRRVNSRRAPLWRSNRILSVDSRGVPVVFQNVCPHAGNRLVTPSLMPHTITGHPIVCSWHSLSFHDDGVIKRCGHMDLHPGMLPEKSCPQSQIHLWQGLVFELGKNTKEANDRLSSSLEFVDQEARDIFDFGQYWLKHSVADPQQADALTSMVNYLDIRHLPRHPKTLAPLVDMEKYEHVGSDHGVIQRMGFNREWLNTELGKLYQESGLPTPKYGAAWFTSPEGFMLEWYPGVIVVSQCLPDPQDPRRCTFYHDFYYHEGVSEAFIELHQLIFKQTGKEDHDWCQASTDHIWTLLAEGKGDKPWGFIDPLMENYARRYYEHAERLLRELVGR